MKHAMNAASAQPVTEEVGREKSEPLAGGSGVPERAAPRDPHYPDESLAKARGESGDE